jgi:prepilin-type N-terminal cleavage/methylation domain-containing protein
MRSGPRHGRRGFNLLEVTIAAFIFSVVSVSFLGVWGQQVRALEKSRHVLTATFLAEELIEEAMAKGYAQLKADEGPEEIPVNEVFHYARDPRGEWVEMQVTYSGTREVRTYSDPESLEPGEDKLKQVIVVIKWEDSTKNGEITLETFLAGGQ